jgi:hypothetical protein
VLDPVEEKFSELAPKERFALLIVTLHNLASMAIAGAKGNITVQGVNPIPTEVRRRNGLFASLMRRNLALLDVSRPVEL